MHCNTSNTNPPEAFHSFMCLFLVQFSFSIQGLTSHINRTLDSQTPLPLLELLEKDFRIQKKKEVLFQFLPDAHTCLKRVLTPKCTTKTQTQIHVCALSFLSI